MNNNITLSIPIISISKVAEEFQLKLRLELKSREEYDGCYILVSTLPINIQDYLYQNGISSKYIYLDDYWTDVNY